MRGRRVEFRPGFPGAWAQPGDYCKVPDGIDGREHGVWYAVGPDGGCGAVLPSLHSIVEEADGTLTCEPSLVMPGGWHGWLRAGVWEAC